MRVAQSWLWYLAWLLAGSAASKPLHSEDWPQFLGPRRDGTYVGSLAPAWPKEGPTRLWDRAVGEGFAGPVVSGNRLILFHRVEGAERLDCLEAGSGKSIWSHSYAATYRDDFGFDEGPRATPAISDGRVFAYGADGKLGAWELATGRVLWTSDMRVDYGSAKGFFGRAASPLVLSSNLFLTIGGVGGAGVVALDTVTGRLRWKALDDEAGYASPTSWTAPRGSELLVLSRSALSALDPWAGAVRWRYAFKPRVEASVSAATPIVVGGRVFLSASYGAGAALLDLGSGKPQVKWSGDDRLSNHYATSVHHQGYLYGFDGRQEERCHLRCVDVETGRVRWSEERFGAGTLLVADGKLLILREEGELVLAEASPEGFKPLGRAQILPFQVRAHPALGEGRLYARSKDRLVAVQLGPR